MVQGALALRVTGACAAIILIYWNRELLAQMGKEIKAKLKDLAMYCQQLISSQNNEVSPEVYVEMKTICQNLTMELQEKHDYDDLKEQLRNLGALLEQITRNQERLEQKCDTLQNECDGLKTLLSEQTQATDRLEKQLSFVFQMMLQMMAAPGGARPSPQLLSMMSQMMPEIEGAPQLLAIEPLGSMEDPRGDLTEDVWF
ncbi:MAG: hypothetical protein J3Q66DRAFT_342562 [Benniella sp.]|nr:MAG: hypothetical protein J3Q66DRAFT_342562 [Benniella sp.]